MLPHARSLILAAALLGILVAAPRRADAAAPPFACTPPDGATGAPVAPTVDRVFGDGQSRDQTPLRTTLQLSQLVTLGVARLGDCLVVSQRKADDLVLYLDGKPIANARPRDVDLAGDTLAFRLERSADSREVWDELLGRAFVWRSERDVRVSVGFADGREFATGYKQPVELRKVAKWWFALACLAIVLILGGTLLLAVGYGLLRDGPALGGEKATYSLGRAQLAAWTCAVAAAYLYIGVITFDFNTLQGSTLVLLGISASTTLFARVADRRSGDYVPPRTQHKGFLYDIIYDGVGASVHRLQVVVWTTILIVVFLATVIDRLAMPEFSENLLLLMGISSGAYIALKVTEPESKATAET